MPPPKKLSQPAPGVFPPPPPLPPKFPSDHKQHNSSTATMPPPPPRFPSSLQNLEIRAAVAETPALSRDSEKAGEEPVSDTLLKLVEYEEEEEDDAGASADESCRSHNIMRSAGPKPFWAV